MGEMLEKVKIKYVSAAPVFMVMPGFCGKIQKDEEALISRELYEKEFKARVDWELVEGKKKKKDKEGS